MNVSDRCKSLLSYTQYLLYWWPWTINFLASLYTHTRPPQYTHHVCIYIYTHKYSMHQTYIPKLFWGVSMFSAQYISVVIITRDFLILQIQGYTSRMKQYKFFKETHSLGIFTINISCIIFCICTINTILNEDWRDDYDAL